MYNATCLILFSEIKNHWSSDFLNSQLEMLSSFDQEKIAKYKNPQNQQLRITSRLLLECGIKHFFQETLNIQQIQYKNNKPFLDDSVSFSFSHAHKVAVCAITLGTPVGIDIEEKKEINELLFQDYLSLEEQNLLHQSSKKSSTFLEFWTKKEAILKAGGFGLTEINLKELSSIPEPVVFENKQYFTKSIELHEGYVACLASSEWIDEIIIKEVILQKNL